MSYGSVTIIERIVDMLSRLAQNIRNRIFALLRKVTHRVNYIERVQKISSVEDIVISFGKLIGVKVQRLQYSLEDSLSALSLVLELLSSLSIIIVLAILWLSP
ncbi:MAG: hypothetical protein QXL96_06355 [Ignisphaera sp.]